MKDLWSPAFGQQDVEIVAENEIYTGHFVVVEQNLRFKLFAGGESATIMRCSVKRQNAVAVLLYNSKLDSVVMVEQMRLGAIADSDSPWLLEPVAGLIELGDSPEETAKRETAEEANCKILALEPAGNYLVSSGMSDERCWVFCACVDSCDPGGVYGLEAEAEDIKVHELPREKAYQLVCSGVIFSASAVISLQWLQLNYLNLQKKWKTIYQSPKMY
jgi:ADP-ribose pyrophosphatase